MRYWAILVAVVGLVGCTAMPYDKLNSIKVSNQDCPNADKIINSVNKQLDRKGLLGVDPEFMSESDRQYNERAHVIIWSLRIGCNNPDRYSK